MKRNPSIPIDLRRYTSGTSRGRYVQPLNYSSDSELNTAEQYQCKSSGDSRPFKLYPEGLAPTTNPSHRHCRAV